MGREQESLQGLGEVKIKKITVLDPQKTFPTNSKVGCLVEIKKLVKEDHPLLK